MSADPIVTIVSGFPRSGTSMMMGMLRAGGIPLLVDEIREPDESNPKGYFEYEPVLSLAEENQWVYSASGKAVKVIYALLESLPPQVSYEVIFMHRELSKVVESQSQMLLQRGEQGANLSSDELASLLLRETDRIEAWLDRQPNFRFLPVDYGKVLDDPTRSCEQVADFLTLSPSVESMVGWIDPSLCHHR